MRSKRWRVVAGQLALGMTFLLAWEWGSRSGLLDQFFFSRPSDVAARVWRWVASGSIWPHLLTTFVEAALSLAIGAAVGVVSGFALARIPMLAALFDPYIRIANSLPRVVLAPIFLLWFGLGIWSKVALGVTVVFFSRPSDVAARVWRWVASGSIWPHLLTTFVEAALSLAIGAAVGVMSGFALARIPMLAALFDPYIRIANSLPRVVLAPIFLLWFGLGIWSKVALGVTVVFFVVFFNTYRGVLEVDRVILDNARMLGASERQLIAHVLIPSALTWIFSSLHVSVGLAIIAVVVAEYMGSSKGIGYIIAQAEGVFDTTGVFAGVTVLTLGVLLVGGAVNRLERRLLGWKQARTGGAAEEFA